MPIIYFQSLYSILGESLFAYARKLLDIIVDEDCVTEIFHEACMTSLHSMEMKFLSGVKLGSPDTAAYFNKIGLSNKDIFGLPSLKKSNKRSRKVEDLCDYMFELVPLPASGIFMATLWAQIGL